MNEEKVLSLLGFAQRAGALVSGEMAVTVSLRRGKAKLLIVAEDASENTTRALLAAAQGRSVPYVRFGTKDVLGRAIGKASRSALAVEDEGFARAIQGFCREEN